VKITVLNQSYQLTGLLTKFSVSIEFRTWTAYM